MKGWRTLAVNAGIAALTAGLHYISGINLVDYLGPVWTPVAITGINIVLRFITTTGVGESGK